MGEVTNERCSTLWNLLLDASKQPEGTFDRMAISCVSVVRDTNCTHPRLIIIALIPGLAMGICFPLQLFQSRTSSNVPFFFLLSCFVGYADSRKGHMPQALPLLDKTRNVDRVSSISNLHLTSTPSTKIQHSTTARQSETRAQRLTSA